jgi:hypothetical protein
MKMVKKILFTIAVVAFLTATVQAVEPGDYSKKYDGMWPYEYIYIPVCTIPVYMDVGYFVQVTNCKDQKIELKQVPCDDDDNGNDPHTKDPIKDFPCYRACTEIKVRANFEAKLSGEIINEVQWFKDGDAKVYYNAAEGVTANIIPGDGVEYKRKICIKAWDIKIWNTGAQGNKIKVADVQVTVKPTQAESWQGM